MNILFNFAIFFLIGGEVDLKNKSVLRSLSHSTLNAIEIIVITWYVKFGAYLGEAFCAFFYIDM